jgi:Pyruvate/2-oxoacid:ferredoxin oxidoreductase delta subunit
MSLQDQTSLRVVLYEGAGAQPLPSDERFALLSAALDRGFSVSCATGAGTLAPADRTALLVVGAFSDGQVPAVAEDPGGTRVQFRDVRGMAAGAVADLVEATRSSLSASGLGDWKPWFPVIDYDRCTNCMQCLSFCLFGVYGVDGAQRIQVQNSDSCKTNCPACSRVCPEAAIMFPKYKAGPINGDVVSDRDLEREKMKVDISALLGGDVYSLLRERSEKARSRFSKERDSDKALAERQKCLTKLAQAGDIPPEVLMSLPSPEEIARRAGEAKARALQALGQSPGPA